MAYETYSTVSWSDGTPISSDRLQQMSTNTEAIKDSTDGFSQGVLSYQTRQTNVTPTDLASEQVIALDSGAPLTNGHEVSGNRLVTIGAGRLLKITFNIAAVDFAGADSGDNDYHFKLVRGDAYASTQEVIWYFDAPGSAKKVAGGSYSVLLLSSTGITAAAFTVFMKREGGTVGYNTFATSLAKTQLIAEDCGSY